MKSSYDTRMVLQDMLTHGGDERDAKRTALAAIAQRCRRTTIAARS